MTGILIHGLQWPNMAPKLVACVPKGRNDATSKACHTQTCRHTVQWLAAAIIRWQQHCPDQPRLRHHIQPREAEGWRCASLGYILVSHQFLLALKRPTALPRLSSYCTPYVLFICTGGQTSIRYLRRHFRSHHIPRTCASCSQSLAGPRLRVWN
jgi:hypothetical protein